MGFSTTNTGLKYLEIEMNSETPSLLPMHQVSMLAICQDPMGFDALFTALKAEYSEVSEDSLIDDLARLCALQFLLQQE